jgi:hypothetical protein
MAAARAWLLAIRAASALPQPACDSSSTQADAGTWTRALCRTSQVDTNLLERNNLPTWGPLFKSGARVCA